MQGNCSEFLHHARQINLLQAIEKSQSLVRIVIIVHLHCAHAYSPRTFPICFTHSLTLSPLLASLSVLCSQTLFMPTDAAFKSFAKSAAANTSSNATATAGTSDLQANNTQLNKWLAQCMPNTVHLDSLLASVQSFFV